MINKKDSFYDLIIEGLKNINSENGIIILPLLFLIYVLFYVEVDEIEKFLGINNKPESKNIILHNNDTVVIDTKTFEILDYKFFNVVNKNKKSLK